MDKSVALMRPKWIFNKPMSLCSKNTSDLGTVTAVRLFLEDRVTIPMADIFRNM